MRMPCVVLFSCHKNNARPATPPEDTTGTAGGPGTTGTMKISLTLPNALDNCELIVSETGGKVLLDTVAPNGTTINATLHTNASLVDVSTTLNTSPRLFRWSLTRA
ncbi:MAG TPA: hypothetical protein VHE34_20885 [Puia sp.]|uniref:hypothetical protein n=1 Tax=Puia sp. TaxID=2045100 RepID=UPI002CEF847F|nr:hypothetical protein [Puia sp.]HVU97698.1 hypothetical protein [Puia sp.]